MAIVVCQPTAMLGRESPVPIRCSSPVTDEVTNLLVSRTICVHRMRPVNLTYKPQRFKEALPFGGNFGWMRTLSTNEVRSEVDALPIVHYYSDPLLASNH